MVEAEPAFLHLGLQRRKPFVQCRPWTELLQSGRLSCVHSLVQMEKSLVVHVMIEVNVGTHHRIIEEKPSDFGNSESSVIEEHCSCSQRRLQQHFGAIDRDSCLFSHFFGGHTGRDTPTRRFKHSEDAVVDHKPAYLKHHRRKRDFMSRPLSIESRDSSTIVLAVHSQLFFQFPEVIVIVPLLRMLFHFVFQ